MMDTQASQQAIETVRNFLSPAMVGDADLRLLASSASSPEILMSVCELIYQLSRSQPVAGLGFDHFIQCVNSSIFSLGEWMETLHLFLQYLKQNQRRVDFKLMLGYLNCCNESPENRILRRGLKDIFQEMLSLHGYRGA